MALVTDAADNCVRFVPRTAEVHFRKRVLWECDLKECLLKKADYLFVRSDGSGCFADLGNFGGRHDCNLDRKGCIVRHLN